MSKFLKILVQIPPVLLGLAFFVQGGAALLRPQSAAKAWGFALPEGGFALSSMIGIIASHGLALGLCLFIALFSKNRFWYYPPMMMFGFLGLGRLVAGLTHGAPMMPERFIPEFVFVVLLYLASRYATQDA